MTGLDGPYDKEKEKEQEQELDINILFSLGIIAHEVDKAFLKAYSITKSNEAIYETNFIAGNIKEIHALYNGRPYLWSLEYPIEEKLPQVEGVSIVPIRNVDDVYNALINSETLTTVLERGLEEQYLSEKDFIIRLFMSIKDKIIKDDLTIHEPIFNLNVRKGECAECQGFANIHCTTCSNVWLCANHWKDHKAKTHALVSTT